MPDDPTAPTPASIPGSTPTGYQRTQGGGMKWVPPSAEHLSKLLPQYEVEALIGRGGMGAVYKGRQTSLDRMVAIKILPRGLVCSGRDALSDAHRQCAARFVAPAICAGARRRSAL